MQPRNALRRWWTLVVLVALALPSGVTRAQAPAPAPTVLWQYRAPGVAPAGRFHLVQSRMHFEPGAATPWHTHPGQVVVTVLEGENTFTMGEMTHVYRAGDGFVELPGDVWMQARNAGMARMSVMATYLLPWDAPLSTPRPGDAPPAVRPTTSYQFKTDVAQMSEPFEVVQQGLEFAPGAATPWHTHPGLVVVTVVAGELTFSIGGVDTVYREGESFVEPPGQLAQARNTSTAPTRVMASYLLPAGAPLSNPQAAPGMAQHSNTMPAVLPNTAEAQGMGAVWPLALLGGGLLVGGAWLRRRRMRR
jgi:quercetin dioxygenase-like cupin family protein